MLAKEYGSSKNPLIFILSLALITLSPAQITPLPDKKFPNRLTPRVRKSILKNSHHGSFVSFLPVLINRFSNSPDSSRDLNVFITSWIYSFDITRVVISDLEIQIL